MRPLLRQLSTVDLAELKGENHHSGETKEEVPPMTVSPSDAPPSEVGFNSRGSVHSSADDSYSGQLALAVWDYQRQPLLKLQIRA